jgi:hypothetical protein
MNLTRARRAAVAVARRSASAASSYGSRQRMRWNSSFFGA